MKNILVVLPVAQRHIEKLEKAGEGCCIKYTTEPAETDVQWANIIIGNPNPAFIHGSERLELLQLETAGTDAYIKPEILGHNTLLTNSTGAYSKAVAEHAFALTMMLQKKLHLYHDEQQKCRWTDLGTVSSLSDMTVAVVGLGDIGLHYAGLVKAMGARVIGVKRRTGECPVCVDELYLTDDLDKVLPQADVVMSVLPNTAQTRHIYTAERFDLMKDTAIFVNCGRGNAVAAEVLYDALSQKKISAAGVDVVEIEPLPEDSPLWGLENLVITPHISGGHHLPETFERIVEIACENLFAYLNNKPLRNVVDFATGYRK